MARPTHFSWIFPWICRMYQAYGKSETLSVSGPDPVAVPDAAPSGWGGGAAAGSRRTGGWGGVGGVGGAWRGGRGGGGGVCGASPTRGAVGAPRGEPMAAMLGVSTTNTGLVRVSVHIDAPMMTIAKNATWAIADTTAGASGSRSRPNAGPMWKLAGRATASAGGSALPSRRRPPAESLDARAPDAAHRLDDRAVREPGIGFEVQGLVGSRGEGLTQRPLEAVGGHAPVVQEERLVLGDGEDQALLDRGRLRRGFRQVDVDP